MQNNGENAAPRGAAPGGPPSHGPPRPGWVPYGQYVSPMGQPYMMAHPMPGMMAPGMGYAPMMMMRPMPGPSAAHHMPGAHQGPRGGPPGGQGQVTAASQSAAKPPAASQRWACQQCTFVNAPSAVRCQVCAYPGAPTGKPSHTQAKHGKARPAQAPVAHPSSSSASAAPRPPALYGNPMLVYPGPVPVGYPGHPYGGRPPAHVMHPGYPPHGYGMYHRGAPRAGYTGVVSASAVPFSSLQGLRPPAPYAQQSSRARAANILMDEEDDGIEDVNVESGNTLPAAGRGGRGHYGRGAYRGRGRPVGTTKVVMAQRQQEADVPMKSTRGRKRGRVVHDPTVYDRPNKSGNNRATSSRAAAPTSSTGGKRGREQRGVGHADPDQAHLNINVAELAAEEKLVEGLKKDASTVGHITERLAYVTSEAAESALWPAEPPVHTHEEYMQTARIVDLRPPNPDKPNARIHKPVRAEPLPKPGKHSTAMKWSDVTLLQSLAGVVSPQTYEALAALADAQLQEQHHSTRAKLAPEEMPSTAVVTDGVLTEALTLTIEEALAVGSCIHPAIGLLRTVLKDVPSELQGVVHAVFGDDADAAPLVPVGAQDATPAPFAPAHTARGTGTETGRSSPALPHTPASQETQVEGDGQALPSVQLPGADVINLLDESDEEGAARGSSAQVGQEGRMNGNGTGKRKRAAESDSLAGVSTAQTVMEGMSSVHFTARSSGSRKHPDTQSSIDSRLVPDVLADMAALHSPPRARHQAQHNTDALPALVAATRADSEFDAQKLTSVLHFLATDSFVDRPEYLLHMLRTEWCKTDASGAGSHTANSMTGAAAGTDWRSSERDRAWYEQHSPEAAVTYVLGGYSMSMSAGQGEMDAVGLKSTAAVVQSTLRLPPEEVRRPQVKAVVGGYKLVHAPDAATVDAFYESFTTDRRSAMDMTVPQAENSFDFAVARFAGRDFADEWHTPQMMESGASFAVLAMQASMQLDDVEAEKSQAGRHSRAGNKGHSDTRRASMDVREGDEAAEDEDEKRNHACARWSSALSRVVHHAAVSRLNVWRMYNDAFKRLEERVGTGKAETFADWDGNIALHLELLEDTIVYARLVARLHGLRDRLGKDGMRSEQEEVELERALEAVQRYELAVKCRAVVVKRIQQRRITLSTARLSWIDADITFKDSANSILAERLAVRAAQGKPVRNISADTWGYLELCLGLDDGGENEWEDFYGGRLLLQRGTLAKAAMPRYYTPTTQQKRGQISAQLLKKLDPKAPDRYLIAHSSRLQQWRTGRGRGRFPNFISRGRGARGGRGKGKGGHKKSTRTGNGAYMSDDDSSTEPDEEVVVLPRPDQDQEEEDDIEIIEVSPRETSGAGKGAGGAGAGKAAHRGGKGVVHRGRGRPRKGLSSSSRPGPPPQEAEDAESESSESDAASANSDLTDGSAFSLDLDWFPMRKRVDSTLACAWELYPMASPLQYRYRNPDLPLTQPDYETQEDAYVLAWARIGEKEEKLIAESQLAPPPKPPGGSGGCWHWPSTQRWAPPVRKEVGRSGGLKVNGRYCWMGARRRFVCSLCWARFGDRAAVVAHVNALHKSESSDVEHPAWKVRNGELTLKEARSLWATVRRDAGKAAGAQGGRRAGRPALSSSGALVDSRIKPGFDWSRLDAVSQRGGAVSSSRSSTSALPSGHESQAGKEVRNASDAPLMAASNAGARSASALLAPLPATGAMASLLHPPPAPLLAAEDDDDAETEEEKVVGDEEEEDGEEEEEDKGDMDESVDEEVEDSYSSPVVDVRGRMEEEDTEDEADVAQRGGHRLSGEQSGGDRKRARVSSELTMNMQASSLAVGSSRAGGSGGSEATSPDHQGSGSVTPAPRTLAWQEGMSMYRTVTFEKGKNYQKWTCSFFQLHKQGHKTQAAAEETHVLCCRRYNHDPRAFIRPGHPMYKEGQKELKGWPGDWIVRYPGLAGMIELQDPDCFAGIPTHGGARDRAAAEASGGSSTEHLTSGSSFDFSKLLASPRSLNAEDEDPTGFRAVAVRRRVKALLAAHSLSSEGAAASLAVSLTSPSASAASGDRAVHSSTVRTGTGVDEAVVVGGGRSAGHDRIVHITNECRAAASLPPCSTAYSAYLLTHGMKGTLLKPGSSSLQALPACVSAWDDDTSAGAGTGGTVPAELADVDPVLLRMILMVDKQRQQGPAPTPTLLRPGVSLPVVRATVVQGRPAPASSSSASGTPPPTVTPVAGLPAARVSAASNDGGSSVVSSSFAATDDEEGNTSNGEGGGALALTLGSKAANRAPRKTKVKSLPDYVIGAVWVAKGQATVVRLKEEGQLDWKISEHFENMHRPARRQKLRDQIVALLDTCIHSGKEMPAYVETGMLEHWQRWRAGYASSDTFTVRREEKNTNILSLLSKNAPSKPEPALPPHPSAPGPAAPVPPKASVRAPAPAPPPLATVSEISVGLSAERSVMGNTLKGPLSQEQLHCLAKVHALRALSQRECAHCHCRDAETKGDGSPAVLLHCKGCYTLRFCGSECQRVSWTAGHARVCAILNKMRTEGKFDGLAQENGQPRSSFSFTATGIAASSPRSAPLCVFCRAQEGTTVEGHPTATSLCLSCEDVRYCSETCADAHRSTHASDCVRKRAEKRAGFLVGMAQAHAGTGTAYGQQGQALLQRAALQQVLLSAAM